MLNEVQRLTRNMNIIVGGAGRKPKKLKAISILEEGVVFMQKAIETNPLSRELIEKEIALYNEAIKELKSL